MHHRWRVPSLHGYQEPADKSGWLHVARSLIVVCMPCGVSAACMSVTAILTVEILFLSQFRPMVDPHHIFHNPVQHQCYNFMISYSGTRHHKEEKSCSCQLQCKESAINSK